MFEFPSIDKAFIIENSSYSSYIKGLEYYNRGFVKKISLSGDGGISAIVEGTTEYNVSIEFTGNGISASCDCPYELDDHCKHIAAVLVYTMENIEKLKIESRDISQDFKDTEKHHDTVDRFLKEIQNESELINVLTGFLDKYPEQFENFRLFYDFIKKRRHVQGQSKVKDYSKSIEEYVCSITADFENSYFYKAEQYMAGRSRKAAAADSPAGNYGGGEYSNYFESRVDELLNKYYARSGEFLKIGDTVESAKLLFAVYEFASKFNRYGESILKKLEPKPAKILNGCVSFHASNAIKKMIEVAGAGTFKKDDGEWFYNHLLMIYFSSNFGESTRSEKFDKLKFISGRHGVLEYMNNFILENFANNYNPMTGDIFYITPENAHECFYLLNIAGERGKAIKIAEKYWSKNIMLHAEYIEFLIKNMEHKKAVRLAFEIVKMAGRRSVKSGSEDNQDFHAELKRALSIAVSAIDSIYGPMINSIQTRQKRIEYLEALYNALYLDLICNKNFDLVDRILNVIDICEKLNNDKSHVRHLDAPVNSENFAANIYNEPSDDDFFVARIEKRIGREDRVLALASRVKDDYVFSRISSLVCESRPDEIFELFKIRVNKNFSGRDAENSFNKASRLLGVMSRINGKSGEFKNYIKELSEKYGLRKKLLDNLRKENYEKNS